MRNKTLWTSVMMGLSLMVGTACTASANISGTAGDADGAGHDAVSAAGLADGGAEVMAKGGGKGGGGGGGGGGEPPAQPATGVVYFHGGNGNNWFMDADAPPATGYSGATEIANDGDGIPSEALHGGNRWLLNLEADPAGGTYPNGRPRNQIVAIAVDSAGAVVDSVVMLNEPDLEFSDDLQHWVSDPSTGAADAMLAWNARRWDLGMATPAVIEAGVYTADVSFDAVTEDVTGVDVSTISLAAPFALSPLTSGGSAECYEAGGGWFADINDWAWQPGAARIVYSRCSDNALMVADASGTSGPHTALGVDGIYPDWSVDLDATASGDQSLVVFQGNSTSQGFQDIMTVDPNASNPASTAVSIVAGKNKGKTTYRNEKPKWSPTGSHIVFARNDDTPSVPDILHVDASGANETLLADFGDFPTGWVETSAP